MKSIIKIFNIFNFFINFIIATCIFPIISILNIFNITGKQIIYNTSSLFKYWFGVKIFRISKQNIVYDKDIIYLSNHVSLTDTFVDLAITNFTTKYISRYMVILFIPFISLLAFITNCGMFINRSKNGNITNLFDKIEKNRINDKFYNMLVYPEGTRRAHQEKPCELKKGFIYHSYNNNLPLQIIFTLNKEQVIDEKNFKFKRNKNLFVYYSAIIDPAKYKKKYSVEKYYKVVQQKWNNIWYNLLKINKKLNSYTDTSIKKNFKEIQFNIYNDKNYVPKYLIIFRIIFYFIFIVYLLLKFCF